MTLLEINIMNQKVQIVDLYVPGALESNYTYNLTNQIWDLKKKF